MNTARLLLHPVMIHRRSRALLFWYAISAAGLTAFLWWRLDQLVAQAGMSLADVAAGAPPLGKFLYQPYMRTVIVFFSALVATGLTAISIVGPIRRIEEWLAAWEVGLNVKSLKVRGGDQYETMIRLLNELNLKSVRARDSRPKRPRMTMNKPIKPARKIQP